MGLGGERDGGKGRKRGKTDSVSLLFHSVIMDTVESNLAACPSRSLLNPVPCRHGAASHLYMSSSVIKGLQLLLSFPTSPVQLLLLADDTCVNM